MAHDNYLNLAGLCQFYNNLKSLFATKEAASALSDGLMSSSDKEKLDEIAEGANNYIHPETSGNKHIPSGGSSGQILSWCGDGTAKWINHNTIDGITDSLTAADSNIALSAKAGNDLQNQISELNSEFSNLTPQDIDAFPCMALPNDTDLNALTNPGIYRVWNEDETPYGGKAVLVIETDESYISQIAIEEGYSFSMSMRYYNPIDGWSDWVNLDETFLHRHAKADSAAYADDAAHAANADNAANSAVSASANAVIGVPFQNTDPGVDRKYHLASDGGTNPVQWIHRNNMCVGHLGSGGNADVSMTFHWNGQPGQPEWLWGGNDTGNPKHNMYVWNPANFNVHRSDCMTTLNAAGQPHGDDFALMCQYGHQNDGVFHLYIANHPEHKTKTDMATEDGIGRNIAATYLPISGGGMGGTLYMNNNYIMLSHDAKGGHAAIRGVHTGDVRLVSSVAYGSASYGYEILFQNGLQVIGDGNPIQILQFFPGGNGNCNLGISSYRWKQLYAASSAISTSDRNLKQDIKTLTPKHLELFLKLQPVSFAFIDGSSGRTHIGFISQDVESAMAECGLTALDFAGFCKDIKTIRKSVTNEDGTQTEMEEPELDENGNPIYIYSLRYEEFIALNTYAIQTAMARLDSLEQRMKNIENTKYN